MRNIVAVVVAVLLGLPVEMLAQEVNGRAIRAAGLWEVTRLVENDAKLQQRPDQERIDINSLWQQPTAQGVYAPSTPRVEGEISGRVRNENGSPVAGAMVELRGIVLRRTTPVRAARRGAPEVRVAAFTSDATGVFIFEGLDPGEYEIRVRAEGYARTTERVMLAEGQMRATTDVTLSGANVDGPRLPLSAKVAIIAGTGFATVYMLVLGPLLNSQ